MEQWAWTGKLNAHIEEMYTGHSLVTVFGRQAEAAEVFAERNEKLYDSSFRAQFISGIIQPALGFVANLNYVIVAVVGGLRVASGTMTLGDVQAFIQYSRQFTQPITQIASMANLLQSGVASVERVFELLDADEQSPDPADATPPVQPTRGRVAFEHVAFSYSPDKPLIQDLSLVAEPGQTIAIVGPTGAGKTTLVNLLMRFYEVDGGRITLDGIDTRDLTRDALRSQMGMVLQDTWLFGGTLAENIAYGADRGDAGGDRRRGGGHARRPVRADAARRVRHRGRRRGRQRLGGGEAAAHHRARVPGRPGRSSSSTRRRRRWTPAPRCWSSRR